MTIAAQAHAFTVSELNRQVKSLLESSFMLIQVQGEISNFVRPSSGHWYFTLKDERAQVRCAMFRNRNQFLKYRPKDGDQVVLRARVSLYEGRGEFQLIGEFMEESGTGRLQQAFEELKFRLQREGLFAPEHKQPLPAHPRHLGVVTSPSGAAIHDILSVLRRRFPGLPVTLYPTAVQGDEAAPGIVRALHLAQRHAECDVLIVGRGGGSLEDLWPFNDERVARAIHASRIPVVSAVGHETDVSIADFVADVRAPTPSAAAELLSPDVRALQQRLDQARQRLQDRLRLQIGQGRERVLALQSRLRHPGDRLRERSQRLDELELRLRQATLRLLRERRERLARQQARLRQIRPERQLLRQRQQLDGLRQQLERQMRHLLHDKRLRSAALAGQLNAVSPLATLERGYAIVQDTQGRVIEDASQVAAGDIIETRLARGSLRSQVTETQAHDEQ
ncbi:exodeoxyribonuclease 7 large subunit [Marinobacterium nitratireducens]|uniref:Exodeoxyribonuclease 7 large subunit n=1 Tax=Marinobacterium nitratireducens TaxID=518897 RepID=A0A917ZR66_9GAMM|nr:exodeoxyribonuclease VII large subunit [Marinobacterium nitratireducens]GGO88904.1 exodeoxyribonuclease 7 large subunit [Marinobacterium nitratireducens]